MDQPSLKVKMKESGSESVEWDKGKKEVFLFNVLSCQGTTQGGDLALEERGRSSTWFLRDLRD